MKNFKVMTLCLLGLSVYGLQAGAEIEYTAMPSMAARKAMFNKQQPANNTAQVRSVDVNTPANNVQAQRNLVTARVDANAQKSTTIVKNPTVQQRTFSFAKPPVDQPANQEQDLLVSNRQSLTLKPQDNVVDNTQQNLQQNEDLDDLGKNFNDGIVGLAKENVVESQQDNQPLFEKPQVEQPVAQEVVSQNQDVVVENPNAARIQELEAKGKKNLTLNEATELRRLKTQQNEQVVDSSPIKQPEKIDMQAVDAQAMDAKTVESINNLIAKFNKSDIDAQVQSARDVYDEQYPNKTFGYKNTAAYKNRLKVVEAQAKDQALSDVKNEFATNADGSPRSNREILNALNAKYRPQSPPKPAAIGSKSVGSGLTMQQEMRVKQIIRENPSINKDDAISQMQSEVAAQAATKESGSNSTGLANRQEVISSNEVVVSPADIDRQIYNDNKVSIDKQTEGLKSKDLANAKNQAIAKIKETLSDDDLAMYKDKVIAKQQAEAKALADKEKERAAQIKAAKMKNEAPVSNLSDDDLRLVNNQIYENNKISIDTQLQDAAVENPVLLRSSQMAKQFKLDAANKLRQTMSDDQQSTLLQQAKDTAAAKELAAAQAPVKETASVESPKVSFADQLAATRAKNAAKAAAQ